jgi:2-keto-4-pentenoate hydratase/2-oxohepta-3-ene-1,7-dioic acid hydratase in catechol pathway
VKFLSYFNGGEVSFGLLQGEHVVDLAGRSASGARTLKQAIAADELPALAAAYKNGAADHRLSDVQLLPPIPDPSLIACIGHNYEAHRVETQREPTEHPSVFFRYPESLRGHRMNLMRPIESVQLDYEGELAVVIGRPGRRIAEAHAWDHIAGVACFNDGSVRDWQHHTRQFGPGKNFAGTAGFGPYLVTRDELPVDDVFELSTRVNGQIVQHARTDQMIFPIPHLLAYLSSFMTLRPGDVIVTGTPGGVGVKRTPPLWLKPGDKVEVEISGVCLLSNGVEQEATV